MVAISTPPNRIAYEHSGRLGPAAFALPAVAIIAGTALGIPYGYANAYTPIVGVITFMVMIVFVLLLAYAIAYTSYLAKCRNHTFTVAMGMIAGLALFYSQWAAFTYAFLSKQPPTEFDVSLFEVFTSPGFVLEFASALSKEGWYSVKDFTPRGGLLWGLWFLEFLILAAGTALSVHEVGDPHVFCEHCGRWCRLFRPAVRVGYPADQTTLTRLISGDVAAIDTLQRPDPNAAFALEIELRTCPSCHHTSALRLLSLAVSQDSLGRRRFKRKPLTSKLLVDPSDRSRFESVVEGLGVT